MVLKGDGPKSIPKRHGKLLVFPLSFLGLTGNGLLRRPAAGIFQCPDSTCGDPYLLRGMSLGCTRIVCQFAAEASL